jgi:6-phosphogluconolactonase (cycloisomerase 2 family)
MESEQVKQKSMILSALAVALLAAVPNLHASSNEYVYVESNLKAPNANSIYAFARHADGSLTQIPGSPFLTGGAGVQDTSLKVGPYDSDLNIAVNPEHTLLYAVNAGSDSIAVFHIKSDGSLTPIAGSPFPSGGTDPVSVSLVGDRLFVVNQNGDFPRVANALPNYTVFHVKGDGSIAPLAADATHGVALGSSPSIALVDPVRNVLFGADFLGGLIQRFLIGADGGLTELPTNGIPASAIPGATAPPLVLGLALHPSQPILYAGFVTAAELGVFKYDDANGPSDPYYGLRFVGAVPNSGAAICWLRVNHAGTRLYSSDTGTNSISVYDLSNPYAPVQIQELNMAGLGNATQFEISPDESYIYAISSKATASIPAGEGNALHILKVAKDGTLDETAASPILFNVPDGVRPQGVAVVPAN